MGEDQDEISRIKSEYARREEMLAGRDIYSYLNTSYHFMRSQLQRECLTMLRKAGVQNLESEKILEIGCGKGGILLDFLAYGADPNNIYGVDLLFERIREAKSRYSKINFYCGDGQYIPFKDESFDIALQFTAFSSVLDNSVKRRMAAEMLRVLRKPSGFILWYDFWINPTNRQTKGIRTGEIKNLFPGCNFDFNKITLAPPLTRFVVPASWLIAQILESLNLLNTHYLAVIKPGL